MTQFSRSESGDPPKPWRRRAPFLSALAGLLLLSVGNPLHGQYNQIPDPEVTVGIIRISDMGANEVLDMLERFTGRPVLRQQNLPAVKINFSSQGPMKKWEAVLALESLLSLNGIAITDLGEKFLKAVPAAAIGTQVPVMIEESTLEATPSQKIYAKFFRLTYLSTTEAVPLLQPLLTQGAPVEFFKSNSLMITDALVNLQRVERILERIDQPPEVDVEILFFPLKHVAASEITKRFEGLQSGSLKRYLENNTTFVGDDRTNQLIVFTHPSNNQIISDFIEKLDVDVAPLTQTEVFFLKHADATEVTNLIEQVITGQQQARDERSAQRGQGTRQQEARSQPQGQTPPQPTPATSTRSELLAASGGENLQFSDFVRIVADPRGNSIVAYGTPSDLVYLKEIVDKIDILLAQVRIEVIIAEVTLTKDRLRGIDAFNADFNLLNASEINFGITAPGTSRVPSGFSFSGSVKDFSISAVIDAARRSSEVTVLSAPTIVTTHNQEATINVGESRPVITATQSDSTLGTSIRSNVQFRDIGIELKVKPLIGANGIVQLEIDQKVESVVSSVTIDGNDQPIIGVRQATSFVSVADGQLIVLGGLQEINETEGKSRLWFFGSIPVLGGLFGSKTVEETKRELLMFIEPHVITQTADANRGRRAGDRETPDQRKARRFSGIRNFRRRHPWEI